MSEPLDIESRSERADEAARRHAVDPVRNVVLEASAGTGKTRVLVERYVNLLRAGVDPENILAMTFTRKAAAEMRERIIDRLRDASRTSLLDLARWQDLKGRLADINISTIDAFCLSLLREFPLDADVDPGFELADETEVPRLVAESLDQAFRICRALAGDDEDIRLVFAALGESRLRTGVAALLDRRLAAPSVLHQFLTAGPRELTPALACRRAAERLRSVFTTGKRDMDRFLADGPIRHPRFAMLADDIRRLCSGADGPDLDTRDGQAAFRSLIDRLRAYFLTQDGKPRERAFSGTGFAQSDCDTPDAWRRHRDIAADLAPRVAEAIRGFRRDINVILSRGVWRIFAVALDRYERTLDARSLVDFSGVLERAVRLLRNMEEFAESRFRLETRYRHVLVDEFQDTSRAQWDLIAELVRSWGEGFGASAGVLSPSIFIVSDRKQSIYGFRDADVALLDEAAAFVGSLRPGEHPRSAISVSFRAVSPLLAFVNDLFEAIDKSPARPDAFRYGESDRFPLRSPGARERQSDQPSAADRLADDGVPLGMVAGSTAPSTAELVADQIVRLLSGSTVRSRSGELRPAQPSDIAILFRSRDSHRDFEKALERRGVPSYVYKGLGFFEAAEIQDAVALLRYLADPASDERAAVFLRSRLARMSDDAVARLAPRLAAAVIGREPPEGGRGLTPDDAHVLARLRQEVPRWLSWVDRMSPAEMLRAVLAESAYAYEIRGPGRRQARENLKKLQAMVARFQNRGYATLARVADHLDQLAVGDESNAVVDAVDSVSLMTVHAAKGLEFPIVFVVNLGRGTGGIRPPIRVSSSPAGAPSVAVADYQSEADEDAQAREREETKRLLYVALTRARDRLYLSATVQDGRVRMGRGSLGEVLPQPIRTLLGDAEAGRDDRFLDWQAAGNRVHRFLVPGRALVERRLESRSAGTPPPLDDLGDVEDRMEDIQA
jgi:ATP-dependent helicase/nuclease subunit A